MDNVITPEPHFVPGYTGHCPQYRFRAGKTYGRLTHKLLIDPCISHAAKLVVTPFAKTLTSDELDQPTLREREVMKKRLRFVDPVYHHPIIPGYDGFVPNLQFGVGMRYIAAASSGLVKHELMMEKLRCEHRTLVHRDILHCGRGNFESKLVERMLPMTRYTSPLIPVEPRAQAIKLETCGYKEKKLPYSKFTVPHFMEDDDEEKFIVQGYGGHIPMERAQFGQSSQPLSHTALSKFSNNYHNRMRVRWCPGVDMEVDRAQCPNVGHFAVYHVDSGLSPTYAGHVPGRAYKFGKTYGHATINAKGWLARHRDLTRLIL